MAIKFFNDPSKLWNLTELLLQGAGVTLSIFFLTLLFAVPLGVLFAQARMSKHAVLRAPTVRCISTVMRSTPLMLQIMFVYFLLPQILPFKVDRFSAVIFAFAVNYAAYFAEIFRSGIQSIPAGQYEAAKVLGYTKTQTFLLHHPAAGGQTSVAAHDQRDHHAHQRYGPCLHRGRGGADDYRQKAGQLVQFRGALPAGHRVLSGAERRGRAVCASWRKRD